VRRAKYGILLTIPLFLLLLVLMGYPIAYNVFISFYQWNIFSSVEMIYIGLGNYINLVPGREFLTALNNNLIFTFISVALEFSLGLLTAVLLSKITKGRRIITTLLLAPLMIASVVGALMWKFLYDPLFGILNSLLGTNILWLSDPNIALYSIIIADVWKMYPFFTIIFLAGITSIPVELFESVRIDGASGWQEFRLVIFPHLLPLIFITCVIRTIDAFTKVFDVVYVLTGGGPGFATDMLPLQLFRKALQSFRWGEAATIGVMAILISGAFFIIYSRAIKMIGGR